MLAACAAHPPAAPAATPPAATPPIVALIAASPAPSRSIEEETRATLDQLVAVDTSHGHETDALKPIADRLRPLLPLELVESSPGRGNLVARYKGSGAKRPLLLIAHVDVVPVEGQPWTVPPFQVTEKDGFLWGRGVNDDKGMAASIVAIALEMARTRPALSRDVIFALTAGEEVGGFAGVQWLAKNRKDLLDAEIALNEGAGTRLSDEGDRVIEVGLGAAEKTFQSYRFVVRGKGGHSSIPPTDSDPVLTLSRALVKVGEFRFPARVMAASTRRPGRRREAREATHRGRRSARRRDRQGERGGRAGSREGPCRQCTPADHLRRDAAAGLAAGQRPADDRRGHRQLPHSARRDARAHARDPSARRRRAEGRDRPRRRLRVRPVLAGRRRRSRRRCSSVAGAIWPGAAVVSTLSTGATDSRYLRAIGIRAYGVSVSPTSRAEGLAGRVMHGPDERRPARWLGDGARLLRELTSIALARSAVSAGGGG